MNNKDLKYIIKRVLIGLTIAFILFNINKCNAYAYVYKGEVWNTMSQYSVSDYVNANSSKSIAFDINNSNISSVSVPYDLIVFKFNYFRFSFETPGTVDTMPFCDKWTQSGSTYTCSHYSSGATLDTSSEINVYSSNFYITATAYWGTNGDILSCFMSDDLKDMIVCPIKKTTDTNLTKLSISISSYFKMYYRFELSGLKYYYNYDSTEIVNGLTGIQNQQSQINNTLNNSNVNGANTDTNSALSSIGNSVSSTLDNTIGANQLFTIMSSFTNQLSNTTCSPITLPIPYTNENITLPCLGTEFSQRIPVLWSLYELIITGVIVLRFWQHGVEFVLNILDPYHIGANNIPTGGGK